MPRCARAALPPGAGCAPLPRQLVLRPCLVLIHQSRGTVFRQMETAAALAGKPQKLPGELMVPDLLRQAPNLPTSSAFCGTSHHSQPVLQPRSPQPRLRAPRSQHCRGPRVLRDREPCSALRWGGRPAGPLRASSQP